MKTSAINQKENGRWSSLWSSMMDEQNKNYPASSDTDLPDDLQVIYDSGKNPWQNLFMQDFVLVAEFSEIEGPRPLFTVPEAAGDVFDKNAFAVHVMSVDYQRQTNCAFSLVDDTQLIFSEDRENIYAYVHHFILYDVEARGFVRPFCMCYISNSKRKILSNLEYFIQEFSKISKHFKSFNKSLFHDDLKQKVADLVYVKDCLQGCNCEHSDWIEFPKNATKNFHGLNSETIDAILIETKNAIEVVETHKLIINDVRNGYEKNEVEESKFGTEFIGNKKDGRANEILEETLETPDVEDAKEQSHHDEVIQRLLRERQRHLLTLRNLNELCCFNAVEGVTFLQKLHQHFYQPFEVFSVVKEETPLLDPYSSAFIIGGSFVMNFLKDINLSSIKSSRTSATIDSYGSANSAVSTESFKSCYDEDEQNQEIFESDHKLNVYSCFRPVTNEDLHGAVDCDTCSTCSTIDTSDTTIASNYTNNGTGPQSLAHPQRENETEDSFTTTTAVNIANYVKPAFKHSKSTGDLPSVTNRPACALSRQVSAVESRSSVLKDLSDPFSPPVMDDLLTDVSHYWVDVKHLQLGSTPQYRVIYNDVCSEDIDGDPDRVAVYDGFDRIFVQCYAQQLCRRKANGPGGGILRMFRKYGCIVHLLYALLRGRTVVILAEPRHQRKVCSLITALWLFVPGHYRGCHRVVLWRTKPLKLTDLGRFKLVGLSKSKQFNVLPNSVERYISTLDFESGCLTTPPYQGAFLNEMLASRHCWKDDALFLAHIHSVYLDISLKVFVCYFAMSFRYSKEDANLSWRDRLLVPRDLSIEYMTDILDASGIWGSDVDIILYFLDVITQQQLTNVTPTSQMSDNISLDSISSTISFDHSGSCDHVTKTHPISLDFTQCLTYKKGPN